MTFKHRNFGLENRLSYPSTLYFLVTRHLKSRRRSRGKWCWWGFYLFAFVSCNPRSTCWRSMCVVRQKPNWIKRKKPFITGGKRKEEREEKNHSCSCVHADDIFFLVTTNHLYCVVDYCSRSRIDNKEMNTRDMK